VSEESRPPVVAIVGPTAVGKTELALRLAHSFHLEVVSADSRQIYRGMDIGTAKPGPAERSRVPHHLVDVLEPDRTLTLAEYQELACAAIDDIFARGKLPLIVGGTGLYVRAVIENWLIPRVAPDLELRDQLEAEAREDGGGRLYRRLQQVDPAAAARIHPRNVRRVIRALEVYLVSGRPISHQQRRGVPRYDAFVLGLSAPRPVLYLRADERVDRMIGGGLVEETRALLAAGYSADSPALSGLGYKQVIGYLRGEYDLGEAVRRIKTGTHRYIRQQYTWFRPDDERIHWLTQPVATPVAAVAILTHLGEQGDAYVRRGGCD